MILILAASSSSLREKFAATAVREGVKYTHSVSQSVARVGWERGEGGEDKKGVKVIPPFIQK